MIRVEVEICVGTSCHLMGTQDLLLVLDEAEEKLPIKLDLSFRSCFGNCSRGPSIRIQDTLLSQATPDIVWQTLKTIVKGQPGEVESQCQK